MIEPCPFCGGKVSFHGSPDNEDCHGCHNIYCPTCGLFDMVPAQHDGTLEEVREVAASRWNKRAIPSGYALVKVEPTDKEFEALFEAYEKDYHGSDQMQDIIDRILALRKITISAAKGE